MEACAGAHFIARQLARFCHEANLISPQFVRPFLKSNKTDFIDAEAICEVANRPATRFVMSKNEAQQTLSVLHRVRESLVRERVKASNQIHGFVLEVGISLPVGHAAINKLPSLLAEQPQPARLLLGRLHAHVKYLDKQIADVEKDLIRQVTEDDLDQRLITVPS
jgi:transposase